MSPVNTAASKPSRSIWLFSFSSRERQEKLGVREWIETARSPTFYSPVDRNWITILERQLPPASKAENNKTNTLL